MGSRFDSGCLGGASINHRRLQARVVPRPRGGRSDGPPSRMRPGSQRPALLLDLAGLDAPGADVQPLGRAVDEGPDPLDVGVPAALRAAVRVAHVHAERRVLPHTSQTAAMTRTSLDGTGNRWPARRDSGARRAANSGVRHAGVARLASPMTCRRPPRPEDLRAVVIGYRDALEAHQAGINRLNVYPVPDGDTGTNMALTLEPVSEELDGADRRPGRAPARRSATARSWAPGATRGDPLADPAGLPTTVAEADGLDGRARPGRSPQPTAAYEAVMRPVEGTILTVVREAAEAAAARPTATAATWSTCSRPPAAGADALARTPELLPVLNEAGVVDAGGAGFLLLLDVLLHVVDGRPVPEPPRRGRRPDGGPRSAGHRPTRTATSPTCATRSCTSSRRPTTPSRPSRTCGPASATRSSWSAATASGTATSTPTTSAPPSRPPSTSAGPARSASPTCSSRSRRSAGSARPPRRARRGAAARHRAGHHRGGGRRHRATASAASSTRSACRGSSPAASR